MSSQKSKHTNQGLGVAKLGNKISLLYRQNKKKKINIAVLKKGDKEFKQLKKTLVLPQDISEIKINQLNKRKYFLTTVVTEKYLQQLKGGVINKKLKLKNLNKIDGLTNLGAVVPKYKHNGQRVIYTGGKELKIGYSKDLKDWRIKHHAVFQPKEEILGRSYLKVGRIFNLQQGILVVCFKYQQGGIRENYSYQLILFDKDQPEQEIWGREVPIQGNFPVDNLNTAYPFGLIKYKNKLISFWNINKQDIYSLQQPFFEFKKDKPPSPFPYQEKLKRHKNNPILKPIPENSWESKLVFNPSAVYEDDKVHLVYRAVGDDDVSVIGYANSKDGVNIDHRHQQPIYIPNKKFETNPQAPKVSYNYTSPWGCGGCEDPKLTKIEDRIYMTYTAWNGSDPPGVALTSIKVDDLVNQNWNWEDPVKLSPPGEIHKNWALFPEKINGKYAILHSLTPKILVDYFDDLDFDGETFINSHYEPTGRQNHWDNWMRGAGPAPLKTEAGWLVLYHAMDNRDPGRYKLGAMVLDHDDPSQIKYRSNHPLLEQDKRYENEGFKSGVVYSCGAVIKDKKLHVYYGGADTVSCVAHIQLDTLLNNLKKQKQSALRKGDRIELTKEPAMSYTLNN
jgi:predicted GH43/DUF377 family glycosyl hydrolase